MADGAELWRAVAIMRELRLGQLAVGIGVLGGLAAIALIVKGSEDGLPMLVTCGVDILLGYWLMRRAERKSAALVAELRARRGWAMTCLQTLNSQNDQNQD